MAHIFYRYNDPSCYSASVFAAPASLPSYEIAMNNDYYALENTLIRNKDLDSRPQTKILLKRKVTILS